MTRITTTALGHPSGARASVKGVPRRFEALGQQCLHCVGGPLDLERQLLALRRREVAQDVISRVLPPGRSADADAYAQVLASTQTVVEGAQAIVAPMTATLLEPNGAERQVE